MSCIEVSFYIIEHYKSESVDSLDALLHSVYAQSILCYNSNTFVITTVGTRRHSNCTPQPTI